MTHTSLIKRFLLCILMSITFLSTHAQGVAVYKKDGTMIKVPYAQLDRIVAYTAEDEPDDSNAPKVPYTHAVDLGLPSGTKWADMNVGAEKPEDYGWYLAWGETEEKDLYDWSTYKWCLNGDWTGMSKYTYPDGKSNGIWYDGYRFVGDSKIVLDPEDDAATANWGGDWRMPTEAEQEELRSMCFWTWTTQNGVWGRKVFGPNGNSIFLPAAGYRECSSHYMDGSEGYYWSGLLDIGRSCDTNYLSFISNGHALVSNWRCLGFSVRPVLSK